MCRSGAGCGMWTYTLGWISSSGQGLSLPRTADDCQGRPYHGAWKRVEGRTWLRCGCASRAWMP